MCGIIGVAGWQPAAPFLLEGLRRLAYRGYDSAGVATVHDGRIHRQRAEGRIQQLERRLQNDAVPGNLGVGHTRWATHGRPTEANAHPHVSEQVAVVHNGIIENFRQLREELKQAGFHPQTETDSEVIAHLVALNLKRGMAAGEATFAAVRRLEGAFAIALIFGDHPDVIHIARRGSPLAVGYGEDAMYVASDSFALAPFTRRVCYLEEGDRAEIRRDDVAIYDSSGAEAQRQTRLSLIDGAAVVGKGNFKHFMLKEIHEQPAVVGETLESLIDPLKRRITPPPLPFSLASLNRLHIIACGTSYYAGCIAGYCFERYARLPVTCELASEFRYRSPVLEEDGAALFISQSGETADTLAALQLCRERGCPSLAVVNVAESSLAREAGGVLMTHAGVEIGVASTKAFTTQLAALLCLVVAAGRARGALDEQQEQALASALLEAPSLMRESLSREARIQALALTLARSASVLYLGRGAEYIIACEGALKLKEISYIHAEAYAAGEMKHGPIALIEEGTPVVVIAAGDQPLFVKTTANIEELLSRGARVLLITDSSGRDALGDKVSACLDMPSAHSFAAPMLYAMPVQLLAYHVAVARGADVDQPRNLAKSVTVE